MQAVDVLVGRCDKHAFEASHDLCNDCGREFCPECLVFPFGPKRAPICVDCALSKSGVRKHAARGKVRSRRELRKERKLLRSRREEPIGAVAHTLTLDDLPVAVPMAESGGPAVRPLEEADAAAQDTDGADAFGDQQTSIVRPAPLAEPPADPVATPDDQIPLRDLTRPSARETSPLEHPPVTDETIQEAFAEPGTDRDTAVMVPARAARGGYTFDSSLTKVF